MFLRRLAQPATFLLTVVMLTDGVFVAISHRHSHGDCEPGRACCKTKRECAPAPCSAGHVHASDGSTRAIRPADQSHPALAASVDACAACRYWSLRQQVGLSNTESPEVVARFALIDAKRIHADSPSLIVCRQRGPPAGPCPPG
jgi:hypothetical protein